MDKSSALSDGRVLVIGHELERGLGLENCGKSLSPFTCEASLCKQYQSDWLALANNFIDGHHLNIGNGFVEN